MERFPVTLGSSAILLVLLIRLNELARVQTTESVNQLVRTNMTVGLFVVLSLCIGLFIENFLPKDRVKAIGLYAGGIAFALLYRAFFINPLNTHAAARYLAIMLFLVVAFFYTPRLRQRDYFEEYVIKVLNGFFTTLIYSVVLYLGIAAILFTTSTLFELNIPSKYYLYSFLTVALIFALSLFLSKIPGRDEDHSEFSYSKPLKILLVYIVIPLITIYTAILFAYFAKILATWEWPAGLVSHLVLWYTTVSVGVIFLITPILKENPVGKLFKIWFPKLIIPILAMMFISIGLRINQYGFTENRYFVVLLGIWVTIIMLYFSIAKPLRNIFIPIALSLFILISAFGPLSGFAVSMASQNKRFAAILDRNQMIQANAIVPNSSITPQDKREISNILSYFERTHGLEKLAFLPDDFETRDMEKVFGFASQPYIEFPPSNYFYYHLNLPLEPMVIRDYDYYFTLNSWEQANRTVDQYRIDYDIKTYQLDIFKEDTLILTVDIRSLIETVHTQNYPQFTGGKGESVSLADMTFRGESTGVRYSITFTGINGRIEKSEELIFESVDFVLLLGIK